MPKIDTKDRTITATGKEAWLFVLWGIATIGALLFGFGSSVRFSSFIPSTITACLFLLAYYKCPTYRWALRQLFCSIAASGTYMGQSMIGARMQFELPDGSKAQGEIVRCSLALDWRVVKTWDNTFYLVIMPLNQPIGHQRWTAFKDVTEEWSAATS